MSHVFECDDETVWDPSNQVGELYLRMLRAAAEVFDTPTGLTSLSGDHHVIDRAEYGRMVHALLAVRGESGHVYLRRMLDGVLPICIAVYECIGGVVTPSTEDEQKYMTEVRTMDLPMGF
ncbi:DUF6086 family protein [Streptomyces sp. NPDC051907]|uniref:DUF6086 family protein n=1 Tax=Streptomyces sp. NPDC051907 TaxID=3155284 RepID=UPI00341AC687